MRKVWLNCAGCVKRVRLRRRVGGDAQGTACLHEHPLRVTTAVRAPSGEIRNMHSAYGYYGLYLYERKDFS